VFPPYDAVIECEPAVNVDVVNVAFPLLSVPVPNVVVPSLKVTVPVAAEGDTVAVNVTDEAYVEGFADEASVVVVFVFANTTLLKLAKARMRVIMLQPLSFTTIPP
jgi:hypothetical protein